jgi:hypothetical protein
MKLRKFLLPISILVGSLGANQSEASVPQNVTQTTDDTHSVTSDSFVFPKFENRAFQIKDNAGDIFSFVIKRAADGLLMADHYSHSSHYSHESHRSHSSHRSHYSGYTQG